MWIVIAGNPVDGFQYFGPFHSFEEATKWADDGTHDWWIVELSAPQ